MPKVGLILQGFVLTLLAIPAHAVWQMLGPYGGGAEAVVVAPHDSNTLLVGTRTAPLYRFKDAGSHWAALNFSAKSFSVRAMKVSSGGAYFLGGVASDAWDAPLYRSNDAGDSWQPLTALPARAVYSLALWAKDPNLIAAGCDKG